jgi:hypothetical protein
MCQSEPEQNENGRFCRVCFFRVAVQRRREKLNLISLTDSVISRLVNGDKTDFLKKLVELKIIQVEGMCIILKARERARVCARAWVYVCVCVCVRYQKSSASVPTYSIYHYPYAHLFKFTHILICLSLHVTVIC